MPAVPTRAGAVAFTEHGSGPPVVLLHANLHDHHDYDAVVPALARHHHVVAVDWPGCGDAPVPDRPDALTAAVLADALEDLVAHLDLAPAVVVGNSVGGLVAARLAITHPERVRGAVLVQTAGFLPMNAGVRAFCRTMGTPAVLRRVLPLFARSYMRPQSALDREILDRVVARAKTEEGVAMAAALWRSFSADESMLRDRADDLTAPTLIVWGRKDTANPLRMGRATHAVLPRARFEVLDTGHVPFASAPDAFLEIVEPFVAAVVPD